MMPETIRSDAHKPKDVVYTMQIVTVTNVVVTREQYIEEKGITPSLGDLMTYAATKRADGRVEETITVKDRIYR